MHPGRVSARRILALLDVGKLSAVVLLVVVALTIGGCTTSAGRGAASPADPPLRAAGVAPLLIHHQRSPSNTPAGLAAHRQAVESLPFDGLTVLLPTLSDHTFSNQGFGVAAYRAALAPMPRLGKLTHNFILVRLVEDDLDLTDDQQWKVILANLTALGTAARQAPGLDGVFFDTEYYGAGVGPWRGSAEQSSLLGDQSRSRLLHADRGREMATALGGAWPGSVLLSTYGPWLGVDATAARGFAGLDYANVAFANRLLTPFLLGLIQGSADVRLRYVDGGELYGLRTEADFTQAYRWMKTGMPTSDAVRSQPSALRSRWSELVEVAFGVYDSDAGSGQFQPLPATEFARAVTAGLRRTDRYVWTYSDRYDWVGGGPDATTPPGALVAAPGRAVQAATLPR